MRFRKIGFAALLLAASLYILLPTADELLIHSTVGLLLSSLLDIPFSFAVVVSVAVYRAVGACLLFLAVWVSGRPLQQIIKDMRAKMRYRP